MSNEMSDFKDICKQKLLPVLAIVKQDNLIPILQSYSDMGSVLENIFNRLTPSKKSDSDIKQLKRNKHLYLLQILGNSYALTSQMNLDYLFNISILSQSKNKVFNWDEQIRSIARVSCSKNRQKLYLNIFNMYSQYRERNFYKDDVYIWGYARLLLWYVDMNDRSLIPTYSKHFLAITNYCLTLNAKIPRERPYITDALIALIYSLTFREIDDQFVEKGSQLYSQSNKLCEKLAENPILSRKAGVELPLNHFFEQLLDGSATQEQVSNMIEID
jgi:hypothetical protein